MCVCMCVRVFVCVLASLFMCECVCVCMCVRVFVCVLASLFMCECLYVCERACVSPSSPAISEPAQQLHG